MEIKYINYSSNNSLRKKLDLKKSSSNTYLLIQIKKNFKI